jgi:SRSO17 transposase
MFDQVMTRIAGRFGRVEPPATARAYLLGLLSGVERKNCWRLAEQAGLARPGPMQRLLRYACWDADAVRDDVRAYVVDHLGTDDGVWEMIAAALNAGITASWVTGDEAYGQDPRLRARLEEMSMGYVLAVACSTRVRINHGRTPVRADAVAGRLPATAWHRQSAGRGAKGLRYYDWAWIQISNDSHRHLLVRRNHTTGELAFYLCWSPD